jgi:hypothetical protein
MSDNIRYFLNGKLVDEENISDAEYTVATSTASEKNGLFAFDSEKELKNWIRANGFENDLRLDDEKKLETLRRQEGTKEEEEEENRRIEISQKFRKMEGELSEIIGQPRGSNELVSIINDIQQNKLPKLDIDSSLVKELLNLPKRMAILYEHQNYGGDTKDIIFDTYPRLRRWWFNDITTSVKLWGEHLQITMYEHDYYKGIKFIVYLWNIPNVGREFNDKASSVTAY